MENAVFALSAALSLLVAASVLLVRGEGAERAWRAWLFAGCAALGLKPVLAALAGPLAAVLPAGLAAAFGAVLSALAATGVYASAHSLTRGAPGRTLPGAALGFAAAWCAAWLAGAPGSVVALAPHIFACGLLAAAARLSAVAARASAPALPLWVLFAPPALLQAMLPVLAADSQFAPFRLMAETASFFPAFLAAFMLQRDKSASAVRLAEAKLQLVFQGHPAPLLVIDPESGLIAEANQGACQFYGYSHAELVGMHISNINILPEAELSRLRGEAADGGGTRFRFTHRLRDGELRRVEVICGPARSGSGAALLFSIVTDITQSVRDAEELERKQAELERVGTLVRAMADNMRDPLWAVDAHGICIFGNKAYCETLGLDETGVLGQPRRAQLSHGSPFADGGGLASRSYTWAGEARGRFVAFEVFEAPLLSPEGRFLGYVGSAHGITKRLLAERALSLSEARYRSFVETASEGIWHFDPDGLATYVNDAVCKMLGYGQPEMLGRPKTDFLFPEDVAALSSRLSRQAAPGAERYELRLRRKDGSECWALVSTAAVHSDAGDRPGRLAMLVDISDYKRVQLLHEARARLAQLGEEGDLDAVLQVALDSAEALTQSSIGFFHFVAGGGEDLERQCWSTRTLRACRAGARGMRYPLGSAGVWAEAVRRRTVVTHEKGDFCTGGSGFPAGHVPVERELVVPVLGMGRIVAVIGVGNKPGPYADSDADSLRTLAGLAWEAVIRMRSRQTMEKGLRLAEEAVAMKDAFLANMSHEIRTPLNGIMGMLQLLEMSGSAEELATYREMALKSARRLMTLLNDILEFSRLESGSVRLMRGRLELEEALQGVRDVFESQCRARGLSLECALEVPEGLRLVGDGGRVRQLLHNLAGNAVKFTRRGGVRVEIWARPPQVPERNAMLYLTVQDTGPGIADEDLEGVFRRFHRSATSVEHAVEGSGLGLAIVKSVTRRMGGTICVESALGQGATLVIGLPMEVEGQRGLAEPSLIRIPEARPGGLRILVVEDEAIASLATCCYLKVYGHSAATASSGEEALEALRQEPFDIVLMDVNMPGMDGLQATRAIRRASGLASRSDVPVVAVTAYAMAGDRERCLEAGMNDYLTKPVQYEDLLRVIQEQTGRQPTGG